VFLTASWMRRSCSPITIGTLSGITPVRSSGGTDGAVASGLPGATVVIQSVLGGPLVLPIVVAMPVVVGTTSVTCVVCVSIVGSPGTGGTGDSPCEEGLEVPHAADATVTTRRRGTRWRTRDLTPADVPRFPLRIIRAGCPPRTAVSVVT
jgi:hypothetical protein